MVGLRLVDFIHQLRSSPAITEYDQKFLSSFNRISASFNPAENLSTTQLKWLEQAFENRWKAIINSVEEHYTSNQDDSNKYWIKLAKDMASSVSKTHVQILMPTVTNKQDANNLEYLADCELEDLFLSEDGTTLYSIRGIEANFQKGFFYTYLNTESGKYVQRPLSLGEWSMIKLKAKGRPAEVGDASYTCAWDYIAQVVFPKLSESKEFYSPVLSTLLELIETFYAEKSNASVRSKLKIKLSLLSNELMDCSIDEINCLYGQKIQVGDKSIYLVDILIECWQMDFSLIQEHLNAVAHWLCQQDASLIVKGVVELEPGYKKLFVGPAFNIDQLSYFLSLMLSCGNEAVCKDIVVLQDILRRKLVIDAEVIAKLAEIYKLRWISIVDTSQDYLRLQNGINEHWIRLAQLLKGAGYLKKSYYCLLMPTLTVDVEPIAKAPITENPLSHYVLSQDSNSLIYLGNCEAYFKANGLFHKCESGPPTPLSEIEIERMKFAHSRYHRYIKIAKGVQVEERPIAKSTVVAVFELVNNSLFPNGLLFAHDYDETQKKAALQAYIRFCIFLNDLPPAEKGKLSEMDKLFAQKICWLGKYVTFKSVLDDVDAGECIAVCGLFFAKMVMDYAPYLKFKPEIEAKARIGAMRTNSQLKVFSNYNKIDQGEAKRRLQILAASLMSYCFKISGENSWIWDCSNKIGHVAKDIYKLISPLIRAGNYKNARYVYAKIMETMVEPALNPKDESWLTWLTRPAVPGDWLESISNETMFTRNGCWFSPELLLATLMGPISGVDGSTQALLESFLEDVVHTYAQSQNTALKEIRVNTKFSQLLQSISEPQRSAILRHLHLSAREVDVAEFNEIYANYIIRRLVACMKRTGGYNELNFFRNTKRYSESEVSRHGKEAQKLLLETVNLEDRSPLSIFERLIVQINKLSKSVCTDIEKQKMKEYLAQLRSPISFISNHSQEDAVLTSRAISLGR